MNTPTSTPAQNQQYQIKEKLAELESMLLNKTPGMATALRSIHSALKKDSALVTILSDEECAILVNGLKKQTAVEIATSSLKKKPKKALNKTTVADL
ncbi:MAG: hypothetical protein COB66_01395 [Coxiella sp. (in: Bacteria)]|nr:MAG: hypothetical protein COB66_01395 [Coxiella sp. (in: g-proteobacteria)]